MRNLIALVLSVLLTIPTVPTHAWIAQKTASATATEQQFFMSSANVTSSTANRYIPFGMAFNVATTESATFRFPVAGTIKSLKFYAVTAPSGGASYTGTVRLNGTTSTAASCAVSSATPCTWTGTVSISAGDTVGFLIAPSGSPTASIVHASVIWSPTNANDTVFAFGTPNTNFSTSAASYVMPNSSKPPNTVITGQRYGHMPDGGTIDKFCASFATALTGVMSYGMTVFKNGAATALNTTINSTNQSNCDNTNSFSVTGPSGGSTGGDDVELEGAPSGTPTASKMAGGARYVPTTAGHYPLISIAGSAASTTAKAYYPMTSGTGGASTTEAEEQSVSHAQTLKNMTCRVSTPPGGTTARVCTLRKNGVATGLTCTITGTATVCNVTSTVSVSDDDKLSIEDDPSTAGTPASAALSFSLLATR